MRKIFFFLFLFLISAVSLRAEYFTIRQFHADIRIEKDGTFYVTEKIRVEFSSERHGIFRVIPYVGRSGDRGQEIALNRKGLGKYYRIWLEDVEVVGEDFHIETDGSVMNIRIGKEDVLVNGVRDYTITYQVVNGLNHFADHDEIYWNVTGNSWQTGMDSASATIHFPDGYVPTTEGVVVYQGPMSSVEKGRFRIGEHELHISSAGSLDQLEGLTFAAKMPLGLVDTSLSARYTWTKWFWRLLPVFVLLIVVIVWLRYGRDKGITHVVTFHPPDGITPAEAGLLTDHRIDNRDLVSLIFWWAEKGYVTIKQVPDDKKNYIFTCVQELPADAREYERELFKGIFGGNDARGKSIHLSKLKYKLAPVMTKARALLNAYARNQAFYVRGTRALRIAMMLLGFLGFATSIVLLIVAGVSEYFVLSGRYDVGISLLITSIIVRRGGNRMVKWGEGGRKYIGGLFGFREFIFKAEADRIRQLTDEHPGYFGETLPFALAFGLADKWADKFKDLNIAPPTWYTGGAFMNITHFTNDVVHASSVIQTNFTTTQSTSSGSSGFSSSGSSGGGGGGGGGGSW